MKEMRLSARLSNSSSNGISQIRSIGSNEAAPRRGMVLPFNPLAMSFDNMNYYVDMPAVSSPSSILTSFSCPISHHPQCAYTFEHGTLI
jgi:hypothetical protein